VRGTRELGGRVAALDKQGLLAHFMKAQPGDPCCLSPDTKCDPYEPGAIVFMNFPAHVKCVQKTVAAPWTPKVRYFEGQI